MFLIFTIISVVACIPFIFLGHPVKVVSGGKKVEDKKEIVSIKPGLAATTGNSMDTN